MSPESYPTAATTLPDVEDINGDNTLNETEAFFRYHLELRPEKMKVGENFITNITTSSVELPNGSTEEIKWYQIKIPLSAHESDYGGISDFKSVRFMRMLMRGFQDSIVLRMACLDLVRDNWRKYEGALDGQLTSSARTVFDISVVNLEENASRTPVNYVMPPEIERVVDASNPQLRELNEQALALKVIDLPENDSRAVYKMFGKDLLRYKTLKMDVHAEAVEGYPLQDDELTLFLRLGNDNVNNYYEYEIPLKLTSPGYYTSDYTGREGVWPSANRIEMPLSWFQTLKQKRNTELRTGDGEIDYSEVYEMLVGTLDPNADIDKLNHKVRVKGKPTLGNVKNIVIGIRNPQGESSKGERSAEVWVNELRLSDFDNKGGWAANARITAKLADVATISFAGSRMTPGFGSIEQHAAEIEREDFRSIDFSTSVEFGKFFPERWRLRIPMYYAYSRQSTLPEYDPLDSDIPLEVALDNAANRHLRDSIKRNAEDYVMRKSLNFTNVGIESKDGKSHFFDWSNLSLTYSYNKSFARNVNLERDLEKNYRGLISYIYNGMPPIVEPFKKSKSKTLNSKYLRLIKDFNFYYMPSMFSITSDITRNYREVKSKNLDNPNLLIEPTYDKDFMWTRDYAFKFNLTRNLVVDFHATTQARIDEPEGIVDRQRDPERYQQWKDTVWNNILDGGRPVNYNHDFSVQYTVPVNKLPFLDWTSLQLGYSTRYDWQAAAVTADSTNLGNVIRNASALQMNGDLSLTSLYNKSKFLREMIRPPRKQRGKNVKFETGMDKVQKGKPVVVRHRLKTGDIQARLTAADGKNIKLGYESVGRNKIRINSSETLEGGKLLVTGTETPHAGVGNAVARFFVGILTGFKTLSVGYSEDKGTTLPGFLPEARWLGQQSYNGSSAPGFKFLFGGQDENFGLKAAGKGWITTDSTQNNPFLMNASRTVYVRALFEPIKKLRVNLTSNWRVVYTGLIDFAFMKKVFKSISVNHNYICKYNIGSFASNLKYAEDARDLQDNWMSLFDVNLVSINEQFNPLISMDMVWANNLTTHWDINRRRDVSLSLVNAQLSETSGNEIVLGLGYRFGNLPIFLKSKQLNNDINVQFDFSIRKNNTIIRRITENVDQLTAGEKVMSIKVSADYTFNNRLNLRLFYDRKVDTPYLSLSYPTTNTNFGLSIRYTLMQ